MKQKFWTFNLLMAMAFAIVSCGGKETTSEEGSEAQESAVEEVVETCKYSYSNDSTKVNWVAYKLTDKVAVGGKFDEFTVAGAADAASAEEALAGLSISIPVESVNSNNPERDAKIKKSFFGTMESTPTLEGKVKSIDGSSAVLSLSMNGVEKDVEAKLSAEGEAVKLTAEINVGDWNAQEALGALNKVCEALHTGADGKSVLWPDVKIAISTVVTKSCQ